MPVVLTHPTGNAFVRALAGELEAAGLLGCFATTLSASNDSLWTNLLPAGLRAEVLRRRFELPRERIFSRPHRESVRLAAMKFGCRRLTRHEHGWASVDAVYRSLDAAVARRLPAWIRAMDLRAVYGYEDGACETFASAERLGLRRIYELPIAYWKTGQRLLREERERLPAWACTITGLDDSEEKLERKDRELARADVVVCPSQFAVDSLPPEVRASKRVVLAPFGSPGPATFSSVSHSTTEEGYAAASALRSESFGRKFRVLFAGAMTQRKGLGDLFSAMKMLGRSDVELVVMGSPVAPMEFYRGKCAEFTHEPPRPHAAVLELMDTCDVLCLPSIVEGRALVIQEAMSRGLPVIITPNTGADDVVEDGVSGFVVPIRSPGAVAEKIAWFTDHRNEMPRFRESARKKAAALTWKAYARKITEEAINS